VKVTLIKPRLGHRGVSGYVDSGRMEPLQIGVLAALLPADVDARFYDDRCEAAPFDEPTDCVMITVETFTARRSYQIAAEYRSRGVPVVLGGVHPTLAPAEAALHADAVVTGDAEGCFAAVIADLRAGRLRGRYHGEPGVPQGGVRPRRDLFAGKGYLPLSLLQLGRGCGYGCEFCATAAIYGPAAHLRRVDDVIAEIEEDCGRILFFVDDNFTADLDAAKELARRLIPLRRQWVTQITADVLLDRELLDLMERSGCLGYVVGFESVDPATLRDMGKRQNLERFDRYRGQITNVRDYGMNIWAAFTLGHDNDTPASIRETLDFALASRFAFAAFNVLTPYPGTPLYDRLAGEGRLLFSGRWWLHPDYAFNHAVFAPRNMSPDALTQACFAARRSFNGLPAIASRALALRAGSFATVARYLYFSRIFRREIYKKQGLRLGGRVGAPRGVGR
jgi:hypothetical protein